MKELEMWGELTKELNTLETYSMNKQIEEVFAENTDMGFILLDHLVDSVAKFMEVSFFDVLNSNPETMSKLKEFKEIKELLNTEDRLAYKEDFQKELDMILGHYQIPQGENDLGDIVHFKMKAIKCIDKWVVNQFNRGARGNREQLKYLKVLFVFDSVEELVNTMMNTKEISSGICLCAIRKEEFYDSYFMFCIKDGENLFVVSDKPNDVNPVHKSRRPDKRMEGRIRDSYFPYELLGAHWGQDGKLKEKRSTQIDKMHRLKPLGKLEDLSPEEAMWVIFMFGLIEEKFFNQEYACEELSYIGGNIKTQDKYSAELAVISNRPTIELPYLKHEDITHDKIKYAFDYSYGAYNCLESKYDKEISEELLNLTKADTDTKLVLGAGKGEVVVIKKDEYTRLPSWEANRYTVFLGLDKADFMTSSELDKAQKWTARYNKAVAINQILNEEFHKNRTQVVNDYVSKVMEQSGKIEKAIAFGELLCGRFIQGVIKEEAKEKIEQGERLLDSDINTSGFRTEKHLVYANVLRLYTQKQFNALYFDFRRGIEIDIWGVKNPNLYAKISIGGAESIAQLLGIDTGSLPDELKNYGERDHYKGNSILQNIDPFDWAIQDPWEALNLDLIVPLSKAVYNNLRKKYGLDPNKFWDTSKE